MNKKGGLKAIRKNRDTERSVFDKQTSIDLDSPKKLKGWIVIATFHTHDFESAPSESVPGFVVGDVDVNNYYQKVPGIILGGTLVGTAAFAPYGPERGYWKNDLPKRCR